MQRAIAKTHAGTLVPYAGALAVCLVAMTWILRLWEADLTVPFGPQYDDDVWYGTLAKSLTEQAWYLHNAYLSAPVGLDLHDLPVQDNLQMLLLKLIALGTHHYGAVLNIYYLLTFPLVTLTSLFAFQRLGFAYPISLLGSLLFTFLPYHFLRGEMHIFLAGYYVVPLMMLAVLGIALGEDSAGVPPAAEGRTPWHVSKAYSRWVCVLAASAGLYYAFFGAALLLTAGAYARFRRGSRRAVFASAVLCAIIVIVSLCNVLPNMLYIARHGLNPSPVLRAPIAAELFGLKIPVMLFPVTGHRIPALAHLKATFNEQTLAVNENDSATLGIVGSLGFLLLVVRVLFGTPRGLQAHEALVDGLAVLTMSALLLALTNGFSGIVAFIFPVIRGYNRLSLYIAFFSFLMVAAVLDAIGRPWGSRRPRTLLALGMVAALLLIGLLDETTPNDAPPYAQRRDAYAAQTRFVRSIEAAVPPGTMIFQLPYAEFPNNTRVSKMWGYEHLQGYLHSRRLRWSYGAMSGRGADDWQKRIAEMPGAEMAQTLAFAGFGGIYVDRAGYDDEATGLVGDLTRTLRARPISSEDGRRVFLDMRAYTSGLRKQYTPQAWQARREAILAPLRKAQDQ